VIIWAILTGALLPVLPLHILWINLITTVALAITLAFEPTEDGIMDKQPRLPNAPIIEAYMIWRIILVSIIMALGTFGLFYYEYKSGENLEVARTIAVNTIVFFEIFYVFNSRFLTGSVLSINGLLGNRVILLGVTSVVLFQLLFTYWPVFNHLFRTAPIDMAAWVKIIIVSSTILFFVEIDKLIVRTRK
jgi:magnesium-transporting ATPase (P-type)